MWEDREVEYRPGAPPIYARGPLRDGEMKGSTPRPTPARGR